MLIDTHAHLFWESYQEDLKEVLQRAKNAGVEKIIVPGTDTVSSQQAIELAQKYPGLLHAAVGIHPEETLHYKSSDRSPIVTQGSELRALITKNREQVVAIGEIGIDLYTPEVQATLPQQKELFKAQLQLAIELDLPVIIHTRNSFPETWEVLSSLPTMPHSQFHCFSVDEEALTQVVAAGFYVSFCGNITWSKRVARLVSLVPDNQLLLETDSPFMLPKARNEPATVKLWAEEIARLRGVSFEEIADMTAENAERLFHL